MRGDALAARGIRDGDWVWAASAAQRPPSGAVVLVRCQTGAKAVGVLERLAPEGDGETGPAAARIVSAPLEGPPQPLCCCDDTAILGVVFQIERVRDLAS